MSKPIIKKITPFDANVGYESYIINGSEILGYAINFAWYGNRAKQNRLTIYNNESNVVVYSELVTTYLLKHIIPKDTLTNGETYYAQIRVVDDKGETSDYSDNVLFTCVTTPTFYFSTPNFNGIDEPYQLSSSSLQANVHYYCDNLEYIQDYKFYLYDNNKRLVYTSDDLFDRNNISYIFKGLDNANTYYIRCIGHTVNGIEMDTGLHSIFVYFQNPTSYSRVYAKNNYDAGCINVTSNLIVIQYNGTEDFEYDAGMINLIDKTLYYDEGFILEDEFTIMLRLMNIKVPSTILTCSNSSSLMGFSLEIRNYDDGCRFKFKVPNGLSDYILYSDLIPSINDDDLITCFIRKYNNVYQLYTYVQSGLITENGLWFGSELPNSNVLEQYDTWINTNEIPSYRIASEDINVHLENDEPSTIQKDDLWFGNKNL